MNVEVNGIMKTYGKKKDASQVLNDVSLHIKNGSCVALLGASGAGKSTFGRIVVGLEQANEGTILLDEKPLQSGFSSQVQMVFQDPASAFNPRLTIADSIAEPLIRERVKKQKRRSRVETIIHDAGLREDLLDRYPTQLSGGQLLRAAIARALISRPSFVVLDEVVSSLDMIQQHRILELLHQLKKTYRLSYLFITHDFQAAKYIADSIAVLHEGALVEHVEKDINGQWHFEHAQAIRLQESALSPPIH